MYYRVCVELASALSKTRAEAQSTQRGQPQPNFPHEVHEDHEVLKKRMKKSFLPALRALVVKKSSRKLTDWGYCSAKGNLEGCEHTRPKHHCHRLKKANIYNMQTELPEQVLIAVTVKVPAPVAANFGPDSESIARRLLEQAATKGYRSNQLSRGQFGQRLGWIGP